MTWYDELTRLGAASAEQLRTAGATERELTAAVRSGTVIRVRKGRYAAPDAPLPVLSALRAGARLTCVSAARSYGLWGGMDSRTHLLVPTHSGRSVLEADQVRHWGDAEHDEIWRVSLADCLRAVARCADEETAVAVLDTGISAGLATPRRLRAIFREEPARARDLAARARPGSDSGVESILRQRLMRRGHLVEQQVAVAGVGRVDARVDGVLFVEVDGFRYHSDRQAFERDRLRDLGMALTGGRRLRFPAAHVLEDADGVVATIEAVLEREEMGTRRAV
ncbi:hypothetical protein [Leifsonia sp. NPDC080035]|uniref:DUF559 domain-containing protein n=1 Tax=Leifsonia sp. NPDC080035 TaxID=3143936 RepID=A0AAU7GA42_9MICO